MFCWQPWQTIHSTSFHPSAAACLNILYNMTRQWGLFSAHQSWIPRNSSASITLSISHRLLLISSSLFSGLELLPLTFIFHYHQFIKTTGEQRNKWITKNSYGKNQGQAQGNAICLHHYERISTSYNTIFLKPDRSWPFIKLIYHTLKAINWSNLPLKI